MKERSFCPRCGARNQRLYQGLCRSCFVDEVKLLNIPKKLNINICTQCNSFQKSGKWIDSNLTLEDIINLYLEDNIEPYPSAEDIRIEYEILQKRNNLIDYLIKAKGKILEQEISQEYHILVEIKRDVCPECSKFASGYFEAVIQIRSDERILSAEELKKVDDVIKENVENISRTNRMSYISQIVELKEGFDYYIGSLKVARRIVNILHNSLGGQVKESPRLMGRDKSTGKGLYRIWISLRLPSFEIGDFLRFQDRKGQVTGFNNQKIFLKDLESSTPYSVNWKNYEKLKIIARNSDVMKATLSDKKPGYIQIIHPESYQPMEINIPGEDIPTKIGEELAIVDIDGKLYIID